MTDTTNMQARTFTAKGTERDGVALPPALFDGTVNMPLMHQAVKAYLANQRQGTAATKTRGFVIGGNQKPWKQKGTGRARSGSTRSPVWVGGGTVFGPHPRDYEQKLPRQMKQLARKSAFNVRALDGAVHVIDRLDYDAPKTSRLVELLGRLGVEDKKVLLLTDGVKPNVYLSGRNRPKVHVLPYTDASTYEVLWSDVVLIEAGALGHELAPVAEKEPAAKGAKAPKAEKPTKLAKAEAKRAAKAARVEAPTKKKPAAKAAPARKLEAKPVAKPAATKKTTTSAAKKPAPKKKGK